MVRIYLAEIPEPAEMEPGEVEPAVMKPAVMKPAVMKPAEMESAAIEPEAEESGKGAGGPGGRRARSQSAAARRLLMRALEKEYPELAGTFRVEKDERGKPFLKGHEEICISISHSGRLAACAIGAKTVGVDVEQRRSRLNQERIARRFHPGEQKVLAAEPEDMKERAFYDLWVRKESFLKAVGEGLRLRLDSFCTVEEVETAQSSEGGGAVIRVSQNIRREACYIRQYELEGGEYSLAACSEEADFAEYPEWILLGTLSEEERSGR